MLTLIDPRSTDPFHPDEGERPSRSDLLDSFLDVRIPETSAMLGAVALLLDDEVARTRLRPTLTDQTLDAVDRYAPEYLRIIASPRPQGPAAILAAMGFDVDPNTAQMDWESTVLKDLADAVGGEDELDRLSTEPLPEEPFDWTGIEDDIVPDVEAVLAATDVAAIEVFNDPEFRTASRRLLRGVALADPALFRRGSRPTGTAGAVGWLVAKANDAYTQHRVTAKAHMATLGLTSSSVSQRARAALRALGLPAHEATIILGSPAYLTSHRRAQIIESRDRMRADR